MIRFRKFARSDTDWVIDWNDVGPDGIWIRGAVDCNSARVAALRFANTPEVKVISMSEKVEGGTREVIVYYRQLETQRK